MRAEGGVFMKIGIREKVIGIISILIILSVASLGIFSYINSADVLSDSLRHDHFELNKEIAEAIDVQFEGYMSGLKMVADNGNTKTISEVGFNQWRRDLFKTYVDNFDQVVQAYIGLPDELYTLNHTMILQMIMIQGREHGTKGLWKIMVRIGLTFI